MEKLVCSYPKEYQNCPYLKMTKCSQGDPRAEADAHARIEKLGKYNFLKVPPECKGGVEPLPPGKSFSQWDRQRENPQWGKLKRVKR